MARNIDERVVEMRFDNKQFESATKETMATLGRLKESLKFTDSTKSIKALESATNNINLDKIASGVASLEKRFSAMGIVGMRVINDIYSSMTSKIGTAISFITNALVERGKQRAMNIENARFQLQALLKDEEKVDEVMANANKAVSGTAYGFDEAAKAASMFAASGIQAGEEMTNALRGIVGVSAMTNSQFENIALIFTAVAGQGRLMGDQLLQLSGRGLNAAVTIADFMNGVIDGSKQASAEVTALIKGISKGMKVAEGDIRDMTTKGQISFKLFSEAMTDAFADSAERANETFTGAFSNMRFAIAKIGAEFYGPLIAQNSEVVGLFNALREKINIVKKALTFDKEQNNIHALSKQFTDSVLAISKSLTNFVDNLKLDRPLQLFYQWVEIIKNSVKGLASIIAPIGRGFKEAFSDVTVKTLNDISQSILNVTKQFKLSDKSSENLKDTTKGLVDILRTLAELFVRVLKAIIPIGTPVKSLGGFILELTGSIGRLLSRLSEWIRESSTVSISFTALSEVVKVAFGAIAKLIEGIRGLVAVIPNLEISKKLMEGFRIAVSEIGKVAPPILGVIIIGVQKIGEALSKMIPNNLDDLLEKVSNGIKSIGDAISNLFFKKSTNDIKDYTNELDNLEVKMNSAGGLFTMLMSLLTGYDKTLETINDKDLINKTFEFGDVTERIEKFKSTIGNFGKWLSENLGSALSNLSLGGVASAATGLGLIYSITKMSKALEGVLKSFTELTKSFKSMVKAIKNIPKMFGEVNNVLKAYQRDLNASAIIKIAGAIAILAAAIGALSLLDPDKVKISALAVGGVAAVLLTGVTALEYVSKKGNESIDKFQTLVSALSKSMNDFTKAIKIKAIGSAVKDLGITVALIAGAIVGLAAMYQKDEKAMKAALGVINTVSGVLIGVIAIMSVLGEQLKKGMKNFSKAAKGVLELSISLGIVVIALKSLLGIDLTYDYETKLGILTGIFVGLSAVAIALGKYGTYGKDSKTAANSVLSLSLSLVLVVNSLKTLFAIELPDDWAIKATMLAAIFYVMGDLATTIAKATKDTAGALKAGGTILAFAAFVGTVTTALMILSLVPWTKLIGGAVSLGIVLVALSKSIASAAKISDKSAASIVLSMAVMIASISAALGVLSMIPVDDIAKAAVALGFVLLTLAKDLYAVSKTANNKAWTVVAAMVVETIAIAAALYKLAEQPWQSLLAAGTAIGEVLLALSAAFKIMETVKVDLNLIGTLTTGIVGLIGIAVILYKLAEQPWQNLIAAGTMLSTTMISLSVALGICTVVGNAVPAALAGIVMLDAFIANLGLVLYAIGALMSDPKTQELVNGGIQWLIRFGEALGDFIGSIINNALLKATSGMPQVAKNLSDFMNNLQAFVDGAQNIRADVLQGVQYVAQSIVAITAANVLSGIGKILSGGRTLVTFGQELKDFGPLFASYANSIRDVNPIVVTASAVAAKSLAELANEVPKLGGLMQFFTGTSSLSAFGKNLVVFGEYLRIYGEEISTLSPSAVIASANAAKILAELANEIPKTGGLEQIFSGKNDIAKFGKKLVEFGGSMMAYYNSVKTISTQKLSEVITEVEKIINLSAKASTMDTSSLSKFAQSLKTMATNGLNEFISAFQNGEDKVLTEIDKFVKAMVDRISGQASNFNDAGKHVINSLNAGVYTALDKMTSDLGREMPKRGKFTVQGFIGGVSNSLGEIKTSAGKLVKTYLNKIDTDLDMHSPSLEMFRRGVNCIRGMANGEVEALPILAGTTGQVMQKGITEPVNAALSNIQVNVYAAYESVSKMAFAMASNLQRAFNQIDGLNRKDEQTAIGRLETKRKINADTLLAEQDFWDKKASTAKAGGSASNKVTEEAVNLEEQLLKKTIDTLKEYTDQLESTRQSIFSQIGLFDEVKEQEALTADELIENLDAQIDAYGEYVDTLSSLNTRLGDSDLGQYLRTLGVENTEQLKEINNMTDEELTNYSNLYDMKMQLATQAAVIQLGDLQTQTEEKLASLFGTMTNSVNLFDFASAFDGSIESINKYIEGINASLENAANNAGNAASNISDKINSGFTSNLTPEKMYEVFEKPIADQITSIQTNQGPKSSDAGKAIGKNLVDGTSAGLTENNESIVEAANKLMQAVEDALKTSGEIHSPSNRTAREIGVPATEGILKGMVDAAAEKMAGAANTIFGSIKIAFEATFDKVYEIGKDLSDKVIGGIKFKDESFQSQGKNSAFFYLQGIKDKYDDAETTATTLTNTIINILYDKVKEYLDNGSNSGKEYVRGIAEEESNARDAATNVSNAAIGPIEKIVSEFKTHGENAAEGFISAIRARIEDAREAAAEMARAASDGVEDNLDIESPSKVMFKNGDFAGVGFVNGILPYITKAYQAGRDLGKSTTKGVESTLDDVSSIVSLDFNDDPIITPTVDLSNVEDSVRQINRMFNESINITDLNAQKAAIGMSMRNSGNTSTETSGRSNSGKESVKIELTQNNYSPKALSRIDIYRQTRNQLSLAKEAFDGV